MSKEIEVYKSTEFESGSTEKMDRDIGDIAGRYFYLADDLPALEEKADHEPGYHEKGYEKRLIERSYIARRAVKGDMTYLALRLHFVDDILHSVEMAAHPTDQNQNSLRFLADEFFSLFKPVDGDAIRNAEIEEVTKKIASIQLSLMAPPPSATSNPVALLSSTQYRRPSTTELVRAAAHKEEMVARANAVAVQAQEHMKFLQDGQKEIERQGQLLVNYYKEKGLASMASVGDKIEYAQDLEQGLHTLSVYTGDKVQVHQIVEGESADPSIPLHLYQDRLYFDEELATEGILGGFDFKHVEKLDAIFAKNFKVLDRMIPAQRGVVLMRVRREGKEYFKGEGSALSNAIMNLENETTYLLVRDGGNVYMVFSELTTDKAHHLFPTQTDIERIFRLSGREVRPEHLDYSKARDAFEKNSVFYKRMLLLLWGLADRENLFGDFYDKETVENWYSEKFQANHLVYVHDAAGTLENQRLPFRQWMDYQNSKLQVGSRIAVNWKAIMNDASAPSCFSKMPNSRGDYHREYYPDQQFQVVLVEKNDDRLVAKAAVSGHMKTKAGRRHFNTMVDIENGLAQNGTSGLCLDDVEIEDLNYYLNSRKERRGYLDYIDLFSMIRQQIEAEDAIQSTTRQKLLEDLGHGVTDTELAKDSLKTAIRLWRAQNGGKLVGGEDWTSSDHETVLNIAFALSGAQNDLLDRLKETRPDISAIEIRVDGKGGFWVYYEPTEADLLADAAKIAVGHVNRARLKVTKRNVSVASPHSRVYYTNPPFEIDYYRQKGRNTYFNPVREEAVISNPALAAKWQDIKLHDGVSYDDLSAMADYIKSDARKAFMNMDVKDIGEQILEVMRADRTSMVAHTYFVQPLCVVDITHKDYAGFYVLAMVGDALDVVYKTSPAGKATAEFIVNHRYKTPSHRLEALHALDSKEKLPIEFQLLKAECISKLNKLPTVVAWDDFKSRGPVYTQPSTSYYTKDEVKVPYETLEVAVLNSLRSGQSVSSDDIKYHWFLEDNRDFAREQFDLLKDMQTVPLAINET